MRNRASPSHPAVCNRAQPKKVAVRNRTRTAITTSLVELQRALCGLYVNCKRVDKRAKHVASCHGKQSSDMCIWCKCTTERTQISTRGKKVDAHSWHMLSTKALFYWEVFQQLVVPLRKTTQQQGQTSHHHAQTVSLHLFLSVFFCFWLHLVMFSSRRSCFLQPSVSPVTCFLLDHYP